MKRIEMYLVAWNPYPGKFWVPADPKLLTEDLVKHYIDRKMAHETLYGAEKLAHSMNEALLPVNGSWEVK